MIKKRGLLSGALSAILVLLLLSAAVMPAAVSAETVPAANKSYEIAVVFDNSGSMYESAAWCRAKYAMEIFASMLNYDNGDKLTIFPMWEVTTDGSTPSSGGSWDPISIRSKADIDKISNLYTVKASSTPFAPVTEAYNYLASITADEKWLVILTDGEFNQDARRKSASINLQQRTEVLASKDIKVQYLGFGGASTLKANEAKYFYAQKSTETSLKDDLIGICNKIFQRSVLPANRLSGNSLSLDLSMKNLIVFAQGANAKITSLTDESGKEIKITLDSGQRKYSTIAAGGSYKNAPTDTSLAGQVVTFAACPKGKYTLNYSGADVVEIFYEPDVDIKAKLVNSDGIEVDPKSAELAAGNYTVTSSIVDGETGEDVTKHELLGNVSLKTYVKQGDDTDFTEYENGATIALEPDNETKIYVEGTYLGKYKVTTKDRADLLPLNWKVTSPPVPLKADAEVLQKDSWYMTTKRDEWKPIKVNLSIDGQPLTEEQMQRTTLKVETKPDLAVRYEAAPSESAYYIYIGEDKNGKQVDVEHDRYKLTATASYVDEHGVTATAKDTVKFDIQKYAKIVQTLIRWFIFLLILAFILWLLLHKAFPKKITLHKMSLKTRSFMPAGSKQRIGKSFSLYDGANMIFSGTAQKVTPFYKRKKSSAKIKVTIKNTASNAKELKIGTTKYSPSQREFVISDGDVVRFLTPAGAEKKYQIRINAKKQ